MQRKILITGFEPFGGRTRNPSNDVVLAVSKAFPPDVLVAEILPVEYTAASRRLEELTNNLNPQAWIGFGLNQRAVAITLERVAVNLDDATIPDNAGDLRRNQPIGQEGPACYRSTLPLQQIESALQRQKIPVLYSDNAGRFVCNYLFYTGLSVFGRSSPKLPAGFVHLPWPSDWDEAGHTVTLATMIHAAEVCVTTVLHEIPIQNAATT